MAMVAAWRDALHQPRSRRAARDLALRGRRSVYGAGPEIRTTARSLWEFSLLDAPLWLHARCSRPRGRMGGAPLIEGLETGAVTLSADVGKLCVCVRLKCSRQTWKGSWCQIWLSPAPSYFGNSSAAKHGIVGGVKRRLIIATWFGFTEEDLIFYFKSL